HEITSATLSFAVTDPPVAQGDVERLARHLKNRTPSLAVITVSSAASRDRLAGLAADQELMVGTTPAEFDLADIVFLHEHLPRGLDTGDIIVWSEGDFTGRRVQRRQPRARTRNVDGFFDDLVVGSFVVHRNIGIARYSGSTTRTMGETTRDYLVLEFRGHDRLFLPTDQIDLLTPYTGAANPNLSRMGGAEWQRTRNKARVAAKGIADELVELYRLRAGAKGFQFSSDTQWQIEMENLFPFTETPDQQRAIDEVKADMESDRPMDRLICADVGFGKTEIALRAVFKAVQDGKQVALLVPTTLLASQHFTTMVERFASFPVKVAMLSRFVTDQEARETLAGLADGSVDVVVGTHKLLNESIKYKDLGLLVVDEEQRFGVSHKDAIKRMSVGVDVLTLTASPIPRTLELALTGIRDLSMVTTPPTDRQPILTHVGEHDEGAIVEAIRRELLREGQVFYVHNRVSDIEQVAKKLTLLVPEARVVVAHAQMDEG
ncbi:MAG: DEAD/DEAH box helicase, partial [Actinobacteria bacterium]|nr:DEAD/DEAH box helicase [Actinomycetota bacterium]